MGKLGAVARMIIISESIDKDKISFFFGFSTRDRNADIGKTNPETFQINKYNLVFDRKSLLAGSQQSA